MGPLVRGVGGPVDFGRDNQEAGRRARLASDYLGTTPTLRPLAEEVKRMLKPKPLRAKWLEPVVAVKDMTVAQRDAECDRLLRGHLRRHKSVQTEDGAWYTL
jgi:hypothetical protein